MVAIPTVEGFAVFDRLVGQPQAVALLTQGFRLQRIPPAYLFVGTPGVGRSLAARCFLELLLCRPEQLEASGQSQALRARLQQGNHPDLLWVEPTYNHQGRLVNASAAAAEGIQRKATPQIRLEQIRSIGQFLSRPPLESPRSMVVVEEAEAMAESAANALLKTLEEPGRASLILIAPSVESLLPTLVSRCQRIPFYRLSQADLATVLRQVGRDEILNHPEILALAEGSPGAAIAAFEQLQTIPADLLQALRTPPTSLRSALDLARQIHKALDTPQQLWLLDYLQQLLWQHRSAWNTPPAALIEVLEKAKTSLQAYVQPRLVWEVTLMGLLDHHTCP